MAKRISEPALLNGPMGIREYALFDWDGVVWVGYRHPGGEWVSLREATAGDRDALIAAAGEGE